MTRVETRKMLLSILLSVTISSAIAISGCNMGVPRGGLCGEEGTDLTKFFDEAEQRTGVYTGHFEQRDNEVACPYVGSDFILRIESLPDSVKCGGDEDVYGDDEGSVGCDDNAIFAQWSDVVAVLDVAGQSSLNLGGTLHVIPCKDGPQFPIYLSTEEVEEDQTFWVVANARCSYCLPLFTSGDFYWSKIYYNGKHDETQETCVMIVENHKYPPDSDGGV